MSTATLEEKKAGAASTKEEFDADCKLYMQLHAKEARIKARMNVLRDRLKPQLKQGRQSPRSLPYVLVIRERIKTMYDWKGALIEQLKYWLTPEETTKRVDLIEANFPQEPSDALYVEINKSYAAKL